MKRFIVTLSVLTLAFSAMAANVVGKYNGKLNLDMSALKKSIKDKAAKGTPEQKKQAEQGIAAIDAQMKILNNSVIKLELKKDGTLSMEQSMNGKPESETGKWTAKGNAITLTNLSSKNGGPKELTGTISKDGKTLFFDLTSEIKKQSAKNGVNAGVKGSLTFKRA